MGKSLNETKLIGHVGQDPEYRILESGVNLVRFSLATSDNYKDQNGKKVEQTEWHNIIAWRKLAEIIEKYVQKGSKLYVSGKLTHRTYEKDGITRNISEIVAKDVILLNKPESKHQQPIPLVPESENEEDDLPY